MLLIIWCFNYSYYFDYIYGTAQFKLYTRVLACFIHAKLENLCVHALLHAG